MTDYPPRNGQDSNLFANPQPHPHLAMSQFTNGHGLNYVYGNNTIYQPVNNSYPNYSTPYVPSQNPTTNAFYLPQRSSMAAQYQSPLPRVATIPSQPRAVIHGSCLPQLHNQRVQNQRPRLTLSLEPYLAETESQDSVNESTMMSEPVVPPLEGYPDVAEFDELMKRYVQDLSPKKQDKALIHARRAANIRIVLIDKKTTAVESAQFRFWVKKMFQLLPNDSKLPERKRKICHEGKPVAVREKLFKILTRAHKQCQHGGRDKTSAQVRMVYSWVPKELISRFVKLCPTCQVRRASTRGSPPSPEKSLNEYNEMSSPHQMSPSQLRRQPCATGRVGVTEPAQLGLLGFSSTSPSQKRWMTPSQTEQRLGFQTGLNGNIGPSSLQGFPDDMQTKYPALSNASTNYIPCSIGYTNSLMPPSNSRYTSSGLHAVGWVLGGMNGGYNTKCDRGVKEEDDY